VILISDACRSGAQSLQAQNVTGGVIFPNLSASNVETVIDRLLATGAGNPAYELPVDRSASNYKAIFTSSLLNAYRAPDKEMEKLVDGILVVPNRRLKSYLKRDVNQRAQASNLTYTQTPDIRIESDDDVYIGRVLTAAPSTAPSTSSSPNTSTSTNATIDDVINSALSALGSTFRQNIEGLNKADIDWVATQTGFTDARNKILRTQSVNRETLQAVSSPPETGIIVSGAAIESVTVNPKMSAERLSTTDATTLIRIGIGEPAGSVALVFKEGTGTVVAAIESYIANIAVNNGEVIDISYILYWQSKADLEEINQIHASIGAAARFGGFRVNGDKETRVTQARAIGDRIRVEKGIDPTLW